MVAGIGSATAVCGLRGCRTVSRGEGLRANFQGGSELANGGDGPFNGFGWRRGRCKVCRRKPLVVEMDPEMHRVAAAWLLRDPEITG